MILHVFLCPLLAGLRLSEALFGGSVRTIFMGSPVTVIPVLEELMRAPYCQLLGVISQPAKPAGRKRVLQDPPVAQFAREHQLKLWQPEAASSAEFIAVLEKEKPDILLTAAYGQILSKDFLQIARRAVINIHPSLLPKYRGATPVQTSLLEGDRITGVSILFTVRKLDAGAIISQASTPIYLMETATELMPRLFKLGASLLPEAFQKLSQPDFKGIEQDEALVTHSKKMLKDSGNIDWQMTADSLTHRYQAFQPWPGIYSYLNGKKVEFTELAAAGSDVGTQPGAFHFCTREKRIVVQCGSGSLQVLRLKPEGKNHMSAADFWNGHQAIANKTFQKMGSL